MQLLTIRLRVRKAGFAGFRPGLLPSAGIRLAVRICRSADCRRAFAPPAGRSGRHRAAGPLLICFAFASDQRRAARPRQHLARAPHSRALPHLLCRIASLRALRRRAIRPHCAAFARLPPGFACPPPPPPAQPASPPSPVGPAAGPGRPGHRGRAGRFCCSATPGDLPGNGPGAFASWASGAWGFAAICRQAAFAATPAPGYLPGWPLFAGRRALMGRACWASVCRAGRAALGRAPGGPGRALIINIRAGINNYGRLGWPGAVRSFRPPPPGHCRRFAAAIALPPLCRRPPAVCRFRLKLARSPARLYSGFQAGAGLILGI